MKLPLLRLLLTAVLLAAATPASAAFPTNTAIHRDSPAFVNWANGHSAYHPGGNVDTLWQTPAQAYGKPSDSAYDIVCLGDGGAITLFFPLPVRDGPGPDFAVFENAISETFLELAFVEVSSDGTHFFRFPAVSLTDWPVGGFGEVYPEDIDGLAGKYPLGYGTPFDLAALPASPLLDRQHIRFVRIVDIVGDGRSADSRGWPIYDPHPTIGSAGFDLAGIGVIHQNTGSFRVTAARLTPQGFELAWESNPGSAYQVMTSTDLNGWTLVETVAPSPTTAITTRLLPATGPRRFYQVVRP
jgi:hypothetical protein